MYSSGYSGMGVNTKMYPQNVYQQGTQLPTLNMGLMSNTGFQNPYRFFPDQKQSAHHRNLRSSMSVVLSCFRASAG